MKIKIKYCRKCEMIVRRNYHLNGEIDKKDEGDWEYPNSFTIGNDILLFCNCGMWKNEGYFKTVEFDVDEEEFNELRKGKDILIKKHIMLANLK